MTFGIPQEEIELQSKDDGFQQVSVRVKISREAGSERKRKRKVRLDRDSCKCVHGTGSGLSSIPSSVLKHPAQSGTIPMS